MGNNFVEHQLHKKFILIVKNEIFLNNWGPGFQSLRNTFPKNIRGGGVGKGAGVPLVNENFLKNPYT
jgi:hypothetical protein